MTDGVFPTLVTNLRGPRGRRAEKTPTATQGKLESRSLGLGLDISSSYQQSAAPLPSNASLKKIHARISASFAGGDVLVVGVRQRRSDRPMVELPLRFSKTDVSRPIGPLNSRSKTPSGLSEALSLMATNLRAMAEVQFRSSNRVRQAHCIRGQCCGIRRHRQLMRISVGALSK